MASVIDSLTGGATGVGSRGSLDQVLRRASAQTGVDFQYLLQTAERESSLNPNLKAKTSSATGLFQFIEQTWLSTIKSDGGRFGLTKQAQQIEQTPQGQFFVRDNAQRQAILDLRKDPDISAKLAGALTQRNADNLSRAIGREPTGGELYIAHFLGAKGAIDLVNAKERQPDQSAAQLFPEAANANKAIFFEHNGEERSVAAVHALLTNRHENAGPQRLASPDPERTLVSHSQKNDIPSRYLLSGAQAAFLAGHFSGGVIAFSPQDASGNGSFGAVFGPANTSSKAAFFAPDYKADKNNNTTNQDDIGQDDTGVIPSRYARVDEPKNTSSSTPSNIEAQPLGPLGGTNPVAQAHAVQDVTLYPSVFHDQKTVVITSSEFGKTDLPLDLSHYLKVPLPK